MNIEQLRQVAAYHAKRIRTRCTFKEVIDSYVRTGDKYFFAFYLCKQKPTIRTVILKENGKLVKIL